MADPLAEIEQVLQQGEAELNAVLDAAELETWRIKYLGTKGRVNDLMELLRQAAPEQKKVLGKPANAAKGKLTAAFGARQQELQQAGASAGEAIDVTEPGLRPPMGNRHILMKV